MLLLPSFLFLLALLLRLELVIYLPEPQVLWFWKDTRAWSSREIVRIGSVQLSPVWECRALSQEGRVLIFERLFFTSVLEFASLLLWALVLWICWLTLCHLRRSLLSLAQSLTSQETESQSFNVFLEFCFNCQILLKTNVTFSWELDFAQCLIRHHLIEKGLLPLQRKPTFWPAFLSGSFCLLSCPSFCLSLQPSLLS